jgi:hypothetical protein
MNTVTEIAKSNGRTYITPEDVSEALRSHHPTAVCMDVLEVIGNQTEYAAEDSGLCASIAWRGAELTKRRWCNAISKR